MAKKISVFQKSQKCWKPYVQMVIAKDGARRIDIKVVADDELYDELRESVIRFIERTSKSIELTVR